MTTFATEDQAREYHPSARTGSDIIVQSILKDASDSVARWSPFPRATRRIAAAFAADATQFFVDHLELYPDEGLIQLGDERIYYASRSALAGPGYLTGLTRGVLNTKVKAHPKNTLFAVSFKAYGDRRVRAELRVFAYFYETGGTIHTERLQGVGSTRYNSHKNLRNQIRTIMGANTSTSYRIV